MISLSSFLRLVHFFGLTTAVGAATTKLVLLVKCAADHAFVPSYLRVVAPVTRLILIGLGLLTLSGIGWLLLGYPLGTLLVLKIVLVAVIFGLGPVIDKVAEPRFRRVAPAGGEPASPAFIRVLRGYLAMELVADLLFYAIIVVWVLR